MCEGVSSQFGRGVQIEMEHDLRLVKFHRFGRDIQQGGNFLDGPSFRDELQHLTLSRRQFLPLCEQGRMAFGKGSNGIPCQQGGHEILSSQYRVDGLVQFPGRGPLKQVGGCTRFKGSLT